MEYLGALLKGTREKKGISLDDAHKSTKIAIEILDNIEQDRISTIAPAYLKGYLKIYSKYLDLDTTSILDVYKIVLPKKQENIAPSETSARKKRRNVIPFPQFNFTLCLNVLVALLLLLAVVVFIKHMINRKKAKTSVVIATLKTSPKKLAVSSKKAEEDLPKRLSGSAPRGKDEEKSMVTSSQTKVRESGNIRLAIGAKQNTYLQVKVDDVSVFQSVLRKGQTENWAAKEKIELSIGSAGSVDLEVNGKLLPPLGRKNQPIKNMIIKRDGSIQIK